MFFSLLFAMPHLFLGLIAMVGQTTPPPFGIPAALTWDLVLQGIADLLSNALIIAAIIFVLALRFGPKVVRAFMSVTRVK